MQSLASTGSTSPFRQCMVSKALSLVGVSRKTNEAMVAMITEGRYKFSNVYEGRTIPYSWCGDFVTFLAEQCGSHDAALNRVSVNGTWVPGQNLTKLQSWAQKHQLWIKDPTLFQIGWFLIIPRSLGDHICIISEVREGEYDVVNGNGAGGAVTVSTRTFKDAVRGAISTDPLINGSDVVDPTYVNGTQQPDPPLTEAPEYGEDHVCGKECF